MQGQRRGRERGRERRRGRIEGKSYVGGGGGGGKLGGDDGHSSQKGREYRVLLPMAVISGGLPSCTFSPHLPEVPSILDQTNEVVIAT